MPTTRPRHTITETEPVAAALRDLRDATDRIDFGELVVLGARAKLADLKAVDTEQRNQRARLAASIRAREPLADLAAAEEVRRFGWSRP